MPPKLTIVLLTRLVPVTVSVNAAPAAGALVGARLLAVGSRLLIVNVNGADSPPPVFGLKTVTGNVPAVAISEAAIGVVSLVELTNVVVRLNPLMRITKLLAKPVPMTASVNPAPPAIALEGERLVTFGPATRFEFVMKALFKK